VNHAQVFSSRFPNATDLTGWTEPNFRLLIRDIGHRVTTDEFEQVCQGLLRADRRQSFPVPTYGEVIAAVDRFCSDRASPSLDPTIERLRRYREEYQPPTPEQKAARRKWLDAFKAGDKDAMAAATAEIKRANAARGFA
jgi:hypothetical protein